MERAAAPFTNHWVVQLSKGPFPDLMNTISNSIGGAVQITYRPSTQLDNRHISWTGKPWDSDAVGLLPFPVNVVSNIVVYDGFGNANTNKYDFSGGFFDFVSREFRGFNMAKMIDPLGTTNVTYFHQSGGRDDVANGEFSDPGSHAKKGVPYRLITFGSDGLKYQETLNKVEEIVIHSNTVSGLTWTYPFISQTITMEYEGQSGYRATARKFFYSASAGNLASTGNLTNEVNYGEVSNVVFSTHAFTDVGSDSLFTDVGYTTLANTNILNKPTSLRIYASSGQVGKLRETLFEYDARGNRTLQRAWLESPASYITNRFGYDSYGNLVSSTNQVGIVTATVFDSTYQAFPIKEITSTFTNQATFDIRSGAATNAVDPKGLTVAGQYDVFFRVTNSLISTTAFGTPTLWRSRFIYNLGGMGGGISSNYVHQKVNDIVDATNGHETRSYSDGLGRAAQTRIEAENGQYRVGDVVYDQRGNVNYTTIPYFSSGLAFTTTGPTKPKTINEYDPIGRPFRVTPPTGEANSPTGPSTISYRDGTNPWANISTNAEGKVARSYHDAYGRTTNIVEVSGASTFSTRHNYDKLGSLTNLIDAAGNVLSTMQYDTLGRKTNMSDSAMGTWKYQYDAAGRLTNQVDAKSQKIILQYADALGRLTSKIIYNSAGTAVATNTYAYDSGDADHTVLKGQLFRVKDRQGDERYSYDVRGRVLKTTRTVVLGSTTYTNAISSTYDDADRVSELTYPGNAARCKYTYDTGGNLTNVVALCGTGASNEVFYTARGFNEAGQGTNVLYGNDLQTTYQFYTNTFRLKRMFTTKPVSGNHQDLTYSYNKLSSITNISDAVYTGASGATLTSIKYDDLDRLTNYVHNAVTNRFSYNSIGNVLTNTEFGTGGYTYHATKIHAVTAANGKTYSYDVCGNMTNRNGATLTYDEENQLTKYTSGTMVCFGYDDAGERLWKTNSSGSVTIWVGGLFEVRNSTNLCHVVAGGRVCTFQPQTPACAWLQYHPIYLVCAHFIKTSLTWPFNEGRTPWTLCLLALFGVLCVSVLSRWRERLACGSFWLRIWWRNCHKKAQKGTRISRLFSWLFVLLRGQQPGSSLFRALIRDLREIRGRSAALDVQSSAFDVQRSRCFLLRFSHSLISVILTVALFLAVCPTNVHAAAPCDPLFFYYHSDHLSGSNIITDRSGVLVDHYEYTAFGKERFNDTTCNPPITARYTGQELDEDTGLYYYGARYYDPELARFIQADSIVSEPGDPQSFNRYAYVRNNPLKYADPTGHDPVLIAIGIGILVGAAAGAISSAIQGGSIGRGALAGAWAGAFTGAGIGVGGAIAFAWGADIGLGAAIGGAIGGAVGGASAAAIQSGSAGGGNIGLGALIGAASGAIAGYLDPELAATIEASGTAEQTNVSFTLQEAPTTGGSTSSASAAGSSVGSGTAGASGGSSGGFLQSIRTLTNPQAAGLSAAATVGTGSVLVQLGGQFGSALSWAGARVFQSSWWAIQQHHIFPVGRTLWGAATSSPTTPLPRLLQMGFHYRILNPALRAAGAPANIPGGWNALRTVYTRYPWAQGRWGLLARGVLGRASLHATSAQVGYSIGNAAGGIEFFGVGGSSPHEYWSEFFYRRFYD